MEKIAEWRRHPLSNSLRDFLTCIPSFNLFFVKFDFLIGICGELPASKLFRMTVIWRTCEEPGIFRVILFVAKCIVWFELGKCLLSLQNCFNLRRPLVRLRPPSLHSQFWEPVYWEIGIIRFVCFRVKSWDFPIFKLENFCVHLAKHFFSNYLLGCAHTAVLRKLSILNISEEILLSLFLCSIR